MHSLGQLKPSSVHYINVLKKVMTFTLALRSSNFSLIECDALGTRIRFVMMEETNPITFKSTNLKVTNTKKLVMSHDKEKLAILHDLTKYDSI
jgi:hypothetical protein